VTCGARALTPDALHAILWAVLLLSPAWILYVRVYEERELELRFGEPYMRYKEQTAFF
jgi:protein-S-isoprenylcysteine O-methyltransferase Ste14